MPRKIRRDPPRGMRCLEGLTETSHEPTDTLPAAPPPPVRSRPRPDNPYTRWKEDTKQDIALRQEERANRTDEEQLESLRDRPGQSRKERIRLGEEPSPAA